MLGAQALRNGLPAGDGALRHSMTALRVELFFGREVRLRVERSGINEELISSSVTSRPAQSMLTAKNCDPKAESRTHHACLCKPKRREDVGLREAGRASVEYRFVLVNTLEPDPRSAVLVDLIEPLGGLV